MTIWWWRSIKIYCRHSLKTFVSPLKVNLRVTKYCHEWRVCVTKNKGLWIWWLDLLTLLLQLKPNITPHNQWLRLAPFLAELWLWLAMFWFTSRSIPFPLVNTPQLNTRLLNSLTTESSASLSWNKVPIWGLWPNYYYWHTVAGLLMWSVLSDKRTGLLFTVVSSPRQRSHSRVRVPW
jgi:hypothetical protein